MNPDLALLMVSDMLRAAMLLCLPVLGLTLIVGLIISLLQVVTQIQEMTLTVIPKLLTAGVALILFGPWMLQRLLAYVTRLWSGIPGLV
jgi:flagellar biosynthetic protein FliQ